MDRTTVAIIGAGPIGLELAVALKQRGIDYLQFDVSCVGATIEWYPLQMQFHSNAERLAIAGVPIQTADQQKPTREEILAYLRGVVQQFDLAVRSYERVHSLTRATEGFVVRTHHAEIESRFVVIAIGSMHRPRLLGIPGEELPHVSHYFREPHRYFQQRLVIVGGKNSAVEAAVRCQRAGARVTVVYRGSDFDPAHVKFWLLPEIRSMMRDTRLDVRFSSSVREIRTRSVVLELAEGGPDGAARVEEMSADAVLMLTGYEQDTSLMEQAGIRFAGPDRAPEYDEATMETNVRGLYLAGTAVQGSPVGRVRVIVENCHVHVPRIVESIEKTLRVSA